MTAHAHGLSAVEWALAAGADGIEHCSCLTESGPRPTPEVVEALARQGVAVCPTLGQVPGLPAPPQLVALLARAGLTPEQRFEAWTRLIAGLYRHGVALVSGTDAGVAPLKPLGILPRAVARLLDSGVTVAEALASATGVAARHCGLTDRKGRLRAGLDADLVVVDGDPLTDIAALERVVAVMIGGHWMVGGPGGGGAAAPRGPGTRANEAGSETAK